MLDQSRIIVDYTVTDKWHKGFDRHLEDITEAVVHHTASEGTWEGLKNWMMEGERAAEYKRGIALFHFVVEKDGSIVKLGPISKWWHHSSSGQHDKYSVGIELIHKEGAFTDEQYESLLWLVTEYLSFHCANYERIVSHKYNAKYYSDREKYCPGQYFDWERLKGNVLNSGFEISIYEG